MKRVHLMDRLEIERLREARLKIGRATYGDEHLRRYGFMDVLEELLDAQNILELSLERLTFGTAVEKWAFEKSVEVMYRTLCGLITELQRLDAKIDDADCTENVKRIEG